MFIVILGWLLWVSQLPLFFQDSSTIMLTIQVVGMESLEGTVQVAIFNKAEGFLDIPFSHRAVDIKSINAAEVELTLPAGQYAIAAYHDKNNNQKLDKNLLGIPKEAYGFSNDQRGTRLGAPSFEDAKFRLSQPNQTIRINLR